MGASLSLASNFPDPFPASWAAAWGEDECGLWMTLEYGGAEQMFRWIEPGTFLMGSPEDERERLDGEIQFMVTLTRGYWLADTACTQALWVSAMEANPSCFQDEPENPVENVSWAEAQAFIRRLNGMVDGLNARLPTEAEWEYACRAGSQTPFSFGENISPQLANYDGSFPDASAAKGLFRGKTVPVKALPANGWGLYQMHGNVWEWCIDLPVAYTEGQVRNPIGPVDDAWHAVRGGSWRHPARDARSAARASAIRTHPCCDGFRIALDPGRSQDP